MNKLNLPSIFSQENLRFFNGHILLLKQTRDKLLEKGNNEDTEHDNNNIDLSLGN